MEEGGTSGGKFPKDLLHIRILHIRNFLVLQSSLESSYIAQLNTKLYSDEGCIVTHNSTFQDHVAMMLCPTSSGHSLILLQSDNTI